MKVARRPYYCPLCGHEEEHDTNHQGEIYCSCKACGHGHLYCAEIDHNANRPFITAILHAYYFRTEGATDKAAYVALKKQLTQFGYKAFETYISHAESEAFRRHDGETVKLFDPDQFDNQYVSNIGRLFQWQHFCWPNVTIKSGYWLEINR